MSTLFNAKLAATFCFGLCFILLSPSPLYAADALPGTPSFGGLFQVVIALVIVIAAIAGSAWLMRRFGPTQMGAGGAMRVVGGVMIGPRERLVLVEVNDTWLIIGVAPGHVSPVHSMPRPPLAEQPNPVMLNQPAFGEWLKAAWQKRGGA